MAIITISRGSMSGGTALAECLAARLGYPCLSREVLVHTAETLGISEEALRAKIHQATNVWGDLRGDRRIYLVALQSVLADACVSGDLVYHGNAGHFLLSDLPNILRVRLIAPLSARIRAAMERGRLDYRAARNYIRYVDQERIQWTKFVYGADWKDPANYDLVINLKDISIETACDLVAGVVCLPAYVTTPDVRNKLQNFALACRVKLALATNPKSRNFEFEVRADGGKVELLGKGVSAGWLGKSGLSEEDLLSIARTVSGVREVLINPRRKEPLGSAA
ncbi:MAG TPA: cytidylate kinase-like family protein [Terriglobia bacterium]|jgi:cytidylate kinase|nr:cytidylate kinase-like family protein [Terriglobia bacterium]